MSTLGNIIEEKCTATNGDISLDGATTGGDLRAAYIDKFDDGDECEYAIFDEDGTKVASGVGVFEVGSPNKILRPASTDKFTYDGTDYFENATTNLTFSGGDHTVRCDIDSANLTAARMNFDWDTAGATISGNNVNNIQAISNGKGRGSTDAPFNLVYHPFASTIVKLGILITTADGASTNNLVAVYSVNADLTVGKLLVSTSHLSGASTGEVFETLSTPLDLPAGWYYFTTKSDSAILRTTGVNSNNFQSPIGLRRDGFPAIMRRNIAGAYPATISKTGWTGENNGFSSPILEYG